MMTRAEEDAASPNHPSLPIEDLLRDDANNTTIIISNNNHQPPLTLRQRRQERDELRRRRREARLNQRHRPLPATTTTSLRPSGGCLGHFLCNGLTLLILPVILVIAVIGVVLFAVCAGLPLLMFLVGLTCLYYCCTADPMPPRVLWRALAAPDSNTNNNTSTAPVTPPGLTRKQIQELILKRQCLGVLETVSDKKNKLEDDYSVWGVSVLEQPTADSNVYWPVEQDGSHTATTTTYTVYRFSSPMSTEMIREQERLESSDRLENNCLECLALPVEPEEEEEEEEVNDNSNDIDDISCSCPHCEAMREHVFDNVNLADTILSKLFEENEALENEPCLCTSDANAPTHAEGSETTTDHDDDLVISLPNEVTSAPKDDEATTSTIAPHDAKDPTMDEPDTTTHDANTTNSVPNLAAPAAAPQQADTTTTTCAHDHASSHDAGTGAMCDICLIEYETGDMVAWSTNTRCKHAFHVDCITDWLIRRPTCPSCRQDYIVIPETIKAAAALEDLYRLRRERVEELFVDMTVNNNNNRAPSPSDSLDAAIEGDDDSSGSDGPTYDPERYGENYYRGDDPYPSSSDNDNERSSQSSSSSVFRYYDEFSDDYMHYISTVLGEEMVYYGSDTNV